MHAMDQSVLDRAGQDFQVTGMSCAACAGRVERALRAVPGVLGAEVNLATERVRVRTLPGGADTAALAAAAEHAGYHLAPLTDAPAKPPRDGLLAALALACAAPLLLPMALMPLGIDASLPAWAQLALATLVQLGFGARFYRATWHALRAGTAGMDTLVVLGTSAAFAMSLWNLANGGPLYFEASAAVIALVRLGKFLEARARRQAGAAIDSWQKLRPDHARIRRDGAEQDIPATALRLDDTLVIRPGERIAADATVLEGEGEVDESLLTGESLPVAKRSGSRLTGGALNGAALLLARVTALAAESELARMVRLVADAQAAKPPVQILVDRISAWFVPTVIVLAALTGLGWWWAGAGVQPAAVNAIAVLVIACPCALGLATPAAIMAGTGMAARHGILIRDAAVLSHASHVRTVAFDKTGTLTLGQPAVMAVHPAAGTDDATLLRLAAALQAGSTHPLARALQQRTAGQPVPPATALRLLPGRGLQGEVAGAKLLLGNARLMQESGIATAPLSAAATPLERDGRTLSYLAQDGRLLGLLAFGDALRPGSAAVVARLRAEGRRVVLLTGDSQAAADAVAHALGITEVHAAALPADKLRLIATLRMQGGVAMAGDGVNDAPALAAADIGIAMAEGADVAAAAAGISLLRADPMLVADALDIAARTQRCIRRGLFWAFAYNALGLPLAAAGLLSPVLAGAAMALSSVSVVGSALLLRRWRPAGR